MAQAAREAALLARGPQRPVLQRTTCKTCGAGAARSLLGSRWSHLNTSDRSHPVLPADVVEEPLIERHREPIGGRLIEESDVVHLGTTPGEQYGWECARCQQVSGLAYGDDHTARRALAVHTLFDCAAPR